jgi:hypothetical protein
MGSKTITTFKCQCGTERSQDLKKGYVNLVSHIKTQHPDWNITMDTKQRMKDNQNPFINRKASTYYSWLRWIIMDNLPFTFVEKPLTRKNSKLENVAVDSLMKHLKSLTEEVERKVASLLPNKFGLVLDGWSEGTKHFIALFACAPTQMILLSIAPPYDEQNYDAQTHKAFIIDVLAQYGKSLSNVWFLVGDNAPVNTRLSDLMAVSFIGCASHRFNLACKRFLQPFEENLQRINSLMVYLRNIKQAGKLREKTDLEPVKRNVTRWSSTLAMLKRFFQLKPFLDERDADLAFNLPSGRECIQLQKLLEDLTELDSITIQLQDSRISLSDVRSLFDTCIESYPSMKHYLAVDAKIVHSSDFESGILKVIDGNSDALSETEFEKVSVFTTEVIQSSEEEPTNMTLAQKAMAKTKNKRRRISTNVDRHFINLEFIPPTTNVVERLFSTARLLLTDYRKSMSSYTSECVMFLKSNSSLWDINTVSKIVGK